MQKKLQLSLTPLPPKDPTHPEGTLLDTLLDTLLASKTNIRLGLSAFHYKHSSLLRRKSKDEDEIF